jgi:signal transduction histidine kinase
MHSDSSIAGRWADRGRRLSAALVRAFHSYASWLVGISWKRFALLSVLLIVASAILQELPPFSWRVTETVPARQVKVGKSAPAASHKGSLEISIDERGVRITPHSRPGSAAASAASAASAVDTAAPGIEIRLPPELGPKVGEAVRKAVEQAIDEHPGGDPALVADEGSGIDIDLPGRMVERTRRVHWGDFLTDLALLWVVASIIVKATYKGRIRAEAQAAMATETAEAESLKRQVVEARLAAMQAQVEPHFLFNTLASIDHLIETDAPRASQMQKNLIALLRASMPSMREANASGVRDLGRELAVVRPYLEILKMRMEERLQVDIDVPDGLLSAEFPPMMIQSLVENAIKHGLEPKPDGGSLRLHAQIVHGKLAFSVADTGLGYGRSATAGTGVGLANIRERLAMLYGAKAALHVGDNPGGGTLVTITVPYRSLEQTPRD